MPSPAIAPHIWELLEEEATRINSPAFIGDDPVQFPRRYTSLPDIEIASLLCATIAWGNRKMICRDCSRLLDLMGNNPSGYLAARAYEELPDGVNIHRTFFTHHFKHFMRGLHVIYSRHKSLNDFARHHHIADTEAPSWELARLINEQLRQANGGRDDSRCLPVNLRTSALKRLNMALRWLVRDDGIVDMGVWNAITPDKLFIPMDVHVADVAQELGLLTRRQPDRKAVEQLTSLLASRRPADPVWFDFALFGIGMRL